MEELIRRLEASSLKIASAERTQFISLIKPAIGIKDSLTDDAAIEIGQSKIGGLPDLPTSFNWPTYNDEPLTFCAQYNLSEVNLFDVEQLLPKQGLLSIFIYIDKDCPCFLNNPSSFRVVYSEETSSLKRTNFPANYFQGGVFRATRLSFFQYYTLPERESHKLWSLDNDRLITYNLFKDALTEIADTLSGLRRHHAPYSPMHNMHQLLGEDRSVQASVMLYFAWGQLGFYPVTKQLIKENQDKIRILQQKYIILLQVDTCGSKNNDMDRYGDCMVIYFGIKPDDLKNKRFDRVVMTFQGT